MSQELLDCKILQDLTGTSSDLGPFGSTVSGVRHWSCVMKMTWHMAGDGGSRVRGKVAVAMTVAGVEEAEK